jgi:hypothetical protein
VPLNPPVVDDRARTDRTPGHRDRTSVLVPVRSIGRAAVSEYVVDDLVVAEDPDGVGPRRIGLDDEHIVVSLPEVRRPERRVVDARDGVPGQDVLDVHTPGSGAATITTPGDREDTIGE